MPALAHVRSLAPAALLAAALTMALAASAAAEQAPSGGPRELVLCTDRPGPVALGSAQWNGWGRGVDNTRYQPEPAIRATDVSKLALKWAFGYAGSSASGQPTIVDGRVFVASATGRVYALDSRTGCIYWTYDAQAGVRTAISIAELAAPKKLPRPKKSRRGRTDAHLDVQKAPSAAFFGDDKGAVYGLDAEKGTLLWKTQLDPHPTARIQASPTLYQDRLYVAVGSSESDAAKDPNYSCCTFRGSIAALDIASGRIVWKTYTVNDEARPYRTSAAGIQLFGPAGVPIMAAPTIDASRSLVYVATGGSYNPAGQLLADAVIALDMTDGKLRWTKQPMGQGGNPAEFDSSPILRTLASGKQVILAGQSSGVVYGLDPDRVGEILWQTKAPDGTSSGGVQEGAAADHHSLYVALSGLAAEPVDPSGSLTAIDIKTGAKRWQTIAPKPACSWSSEHECPHAQAQAVTVIPGVAFAGSMDGHLRAYSTIDGKILWDFDTAKDFVTVNRVKASGGSLAGGGATIVNGVVYVNSGGGQGRPGNVLLAFSVDGK
jgi:polyvinyl alcohol dehydrogenase (cytochrome)